MSDFIIDSFLAKRVLKTVDAGLVVGMGKPIPGQMCVEAAVCYALGLPHSDEPGCVDTHLRKLKLILNDSAWASPAARAAGMRRLAVVQLGSKGHLDREEFRRRCWLAVGQVVVPFVLRAAASNEKSFTRQNSLLATARQCESAIVPEDLRQAILTADVLVIEYRRTTALSFFCSARDITSIAQSACRLADSGPWRHDGISFANKCLSIFAEAVVQILIDMKVPGVQWLSLTEEKY